MKVVVLLESMWGGEERRAPWWFRINPHNASGRRLYKLVGTDVPMVVTNCCPIMQVSANHHGVPDAKYVADNLRRLGPVTLLLVCGAVAAKTYAASGYAAQGAVLQLKHPAARNWTRQEVQQRAEEIRRILSERK